MISWVPAEQPQFLKMWQNTSKGMQFSHRAPKPKGAPVRLSLPKFPPSRAASPFGFQFPELLPWAAKLVAQTQQTQTGGDTYEWCEPRDVKSGVCSSSTRLLEPGPAFALPKKHGLCWEVSWLIPAAPSGTAPTDSLDASSLFWRVPGLHSIYIYIYMQALRYIYIYIYISVCI